jgi:hypothetical protein
MKPKAKPSNFDVLVIEATKLLAQAVKERHADDITINAYADGHADLQLFYSEREEKISVSSKGVKAG